MEGGDLILELCHEAGDVGSEDEIVKEMRLVINFSFVTKFGEYTQS